MYDGVLENGNFLIFTFFPLKYSFTALVSPGNIP